jgi:hypothetical protein
MKVVIISIALACVLACMDNVLTVVCSLVLMLYVFTRLRNNKDMALRIYKEIIKIENKVFN